jgi:hypothetical protein
MAAVDHIRIQARCPNDHPVRAADGDAVRDGSGNGGGGDPRGVRGVRQQPGKDRGTVNDDKPRGLLALRCPYCGGEIEAELTYTGYAYSEHRDLTGYECENYTCNARWDKRGQPERGSQLHPLDGEVTSA